MKTLWIADDLEKDKTGFLAVEVTLIESGIYEKVDGSATYLRINDAHPNFSDIKCEVCGITIEFGWENFDYPTQSVCDDHVIIANPQRSTEIENKILDLISV